MMKKFVLLIVVGLLAYSVQASPIDVTPIVGYGFNEAEQPYGMPSPAFYTGDMSGAHHGKLEFRGQVGPAGFGDPTPPEPPFTIPPTPKAPPLTNFVASTELNPDLPIHPFASAGNNFLRLATGDSVKISNINNGDLAFGNNDDWTVETWFFTTDAYKENLFQLHVESNFKPNIRIRMMAGGVLRGRIGSDLGSTPDTDIWLDSPGGYNDNQWHHVAIQKDGAYDPCGIDNGVFRLIIDGGIAYGGVTLEAPLTAPVSFGELVDYQFGFVNGFRDDYWYAANVGYDDFRISGSALAVEDLGFFGQIPEPATLVLLGIGGLLLRRRR